MASVRTPGPLSGVRGLFLGSETLARNSAPWPAPPGAPNPGSSAIDNLVAGGTIREQSLSAAMLEASQMFGDPLGVWSGLVWFKNAVRDLRPNLELIDEKVLQPYPFGRLLSHIGKQFDEEIVQKYADRFTEECIVKDGSWSTCAWSGAKNLGLSALSTVGAGEVVLKSAATGFVNFVKGEGIISAQGAEGWRAAVESAFLIKDLASAARHVHDLATAAKGLKKAKVRKDGGLDRRTSPVKEIEKELRKVGKSMLADVRDAVDLNDGAKPDGGGQLPRPNHFEVDRPIKVMDGDD